MYITRAYFALNLALTGVLPYELCAALICIVYIWYRRACVRSNLAMEDHIEYE